MASAAGNRAARAVVDLSEGTIIATVEIAAPRERVFQALTSPDEVLRWWGSPETYRTTSWVADLRAGGRWRADGKGADGKPFSVGGEILEVDPPRKLTVTWSSDWDAGHSTSVTYRLESTAGGTRLTVRHEGFAGRADSARGHTRGWELVLGWLAAHVAGLRPVRYFLCRLIPPRPSFPADMTPDEAKVMQAHVGYWTEQAERGVAVVFGPVADPKGAWGVGIVAMRDEAEVRALEAGDPAIASRRGFRYEVLPMLQAVVGR